MYCKFFFTLFEIEKLLNPVNQEQNRRRNFKTFFMLNSTEHESLIAHTR